MRSTAVGMVMLNDERKHVWKANDAENRAIVDAWAALLEKKMKNLDGSTIKIVKGKTIIHSVRTAQQVGEQLLKAGCRSVIMVYNVWNFPFLAWPLVNCFGIDTPILSLSNNNGKWPGNVGLLATDGALRQAGRRTHRIVGEIGDAATQEKVVSWVRAAQARTTIKNEVFGLYGGHSMGMETGFFHLTATLKALGTTCYQVDQLLLTEVMKGVSDEEVKKGLTWFKRLLGQRIHWDGDMLTEETLSRQIRLYCAMRQVNEEEGFDFCGLKGQRELTEYVCLGDVPEMVMNDPYDWNGEKEPTVCATEADAYAGITMQLMKYLSGGYPTLFMDVRLYHPEKDLWDWCNSGNHASYFASQSLSAKKNFETVSFHPALKYFFKAGGASVEFDALPGPMTFARLGLWDEKPYLVIVSGQAVELPAEDRKALNDQTNPTWPHVHARLDCDFEEFLATFPCNHVLGLAGDHVQGLTYLSEIAGITPVVLGQRGRDRVKPIWERV